tara:strand:+ start:535 stop:780 length:246 start_codon:yes stop_codon:yes gene_type:complete
MITEKQQARHDIDVIKASLRAVIKQVSSIKGAYQQPMDRVLEPLRTAIKQLDEIYHEDWIGYEMTETFLNAVETMEKLKDK